MSLIPTCLTALAAVSIPQDGLVGPTFAMTEYDVGASDAIPVSGDIDADGHQDLVVYSRVFSQPGLSILFGRGDGSFEPALRIDLPAYPNGLALGDIDGDGDLDRSRCHTHEHGLTELCTRRVPNPGGIDPGQRDGDMVLGRSSRRSRSAGWNALHRWPAHAQFIATLERSVRGVIVERRLRGIRHSAWNHPVLSVLVQRPDGTREAVQLLERDSRTRRAMTRSLER